jgi:G:T/U-mismatch repair DNA glycosylase
MFLLELGLLSPWLPIESEKRFLFHLGLLSSCGVCFWTTMQRRERENESRDWEKLQDEQDDICLP